MNRWPNRNKRVINKGEGDICIVELIDLKRNNKQILKINNSNKINLTINNKKYDLIILK